MSSSLTCVYILTTRYIDGTFYLFCLDQESRPYTLCVVEHHTYLYVKSNKGRMCGRAEFAGEKISINKILEENNIRPPNPIEVKEFYDAQNYSEHKTRHYKIHAKSYEELLKVKKLMTNNNYAIAEFPKEENKFFADLGMKPCQWIAFDEGNTTPVAIGPVDTKRDRVELAIRSSDIKHLQESEPLPPRVLEMTFDCETYSARYGINGSLSMPDPLLMRDTLYCISLLFTWSDEDAPHKTICICVHDEDIDTGNPDEEVIAVKDEESLFRTFFDLVRMYDPDVIYGHNSSCYDFGYIAKRTSMDDYGSLGRLETFSDTIELPKSSTVYEIKLDLPSSEQYTTRSWEGAGGTWHEYVIPTCYGRIILDTLIMLKKMKTSPGTPGELQSHSLKSLGEFLVGESKTDMSYAETFYAYRSKVTERIARICSYCIQDSRLCMKIFHRTKCWVSVRESASIFFQDANEVTITGQTRKSYTNFIRTGERLGFAFHPISRNNDFKLKGGHVEVPVKGKHANVITLDFASMYPTAQRAYNICPSTYSKLPPSGCTPDEYETLEIPVEVGVQELPAHYEDYEGPGGEEIDPAMIDAAGYIEEVMKWNRFNPAYRNAFMNLVRTNCGLPTQGSIQTMIVHFVKTSKRPGILPTIQEELSDSRTKYKKLMKDAAKRGDKVDEEMYDQRQQLVKVVMNSIYGCLGAAVGNMSFPEGAAAITFIGRRSIQNVRTMLVTHGCKIIYGDTDSLMFQVPRKESSSGLKEYDDEIPHLNAPVRDDVIEEGMKITEFVNATMQKPMMMEFEKVINAVFIDKKRYMGYITWPKKAIFVRGAAAVRGDTTPFARQLYTSILTMILEDKTHDEVTTALNTQIEKLRAGHVSNEMLSVSKMLAHSYVSPSAPMNVFARYLNSIGELAEPGTKIPLIVTKQAKPGPRSFSYRPPTTTEPIDYEYYAEMALRPLTKLIEAAFINT